MFLANEQSTAREASMRKKMSLRLDAKAHLQNYHYPLVRGIGTRQLGAGAGSRAGELTRRIPAGSVGCLSEGERALERTGRGPTSRGANEAISDKQRSYYTHQETRATTQSNGLWALRNTGSVFGE
jgi:hypothetical protein